MLGLTKKFSTEEIYNLKPEDQSSSPDSVLVTFQKFSVAF